MSQKTTKKKQPFHKSILYLFISMLGIYASITLTGVCHDNLCRERTIAFWIFAWNHAGDNFGCDFDCGYDSFCSGYQWRLGCDYDYGCDLCYDCVCENAVLRFSFANPNWTEILIVYVFARKMSLFCSS